MAVFRNTYQLCVLVCAGIFPDSLYIDMKHIIRLFVAPLDQIPSERACICQTLFLQFISTETYMILLRLSATTFE